MKAELRRQIADRAALLAVDKFEAFVKQWSYGCRECGEPRAVEFAEVFPEELLDLQHDIEDELYRDLVSVRA